MARWFSLAAAAVRLIGGVIGAVILVHAAFVLFGANPANALVMFTTSWRDNFGWFTKDLFTTTNPKFGEAINDALAAVIYVVLGNLISKLIVRLTPAEKARARSE
jgi:ABC-type branched-subunit amino acid transport system permease subunit